PRAQSGTGRDGPARRAEAAVRPPHRQRVPDSRKRPLRGARRHRRPHGGRRAPALERVGHVVETLEFVTAPVCNVSLRAGEGALAVAHSGVRSVVTRARAASPLRLLMPKNDGTAAWVYTSTFGGGLVGGDCIDLDVDIGAGAA